MNNKEIVPNKLREVREEYKENKKDEKHRRPPDKDENVKMQKTKPSASDNEEFTLQYMADICEVDKGTISKYETGKSPIPAWVLLAYADEFNVSVDYLLNRSEAQSAENYSAGHELGLTDEAIETLKFLKEVSGDEMNPISVVNAFLNNKELSFNFFNHLFQLIVSEFHHEQTKEFHEKWQHVSGLRRLEQDFISTIQDFVRDSVIPGLEDSVKKACEVNNLLLEIQNSPDYHKFD